MIVIAGNTVQPGSIGEFAPGSIESIILNALASGSSKDVYDSADQLKFELTMECRGFAGDYCVNQHIRFTAADFLYILVHIALVLIFVYLQHI